MTEKKRIAQLMAEKCMDLFETATREGDRQTERDLSAKARHSPYENFPEFVPISVELFELCEYWVRCEFSEQWTFFFSECSSSLINFSERRINELATILGDDHIAKAREALHTCQAKKTPTLWRIFSNGTKAQWDLVRRLFWDEARKLPTEDGQAMKEHGEDFLETLVNAALEENAIASGGGAPDASIHKERIGDEVQ